MNIEKLNLVELNAQEVREVDGGIRPVHPAWGWAALGMAIFDLVVGIHEGMQENSENRCGC